MRRLLDEEWTPESADRWTVHDLVAAVLSAVSFVAAAAGSAYAVFGDARGWWILGVALGASLLLWAVIDRKLRAQSVAFRRREEAHKDVVEDRQRWGE